MNPKSQAEEKMHKLASNSDKEEITHTHTHTRLEQLIEGAETCRFRKWDLLANDAPAAP